MSATGAETTRQTLHRIAAHIVGRRRHVVTGRFGLRATPGGFGTPAFGEGPEVVRVAGDALVRETSAGVAYQSISGTSMRALAEFSGVVIDGDFSVGADTPPLGDPDAVLELDRAESLRLADWVAVGWQAIDDVLATLPADAAPAVLQLWPEHFDAGTNVGVGDGDRMNLGASPGDSFCAEPYFYAGPWTAARPGDPAFWNAPFGAVLPRSELGGRDPVAAGVAFLQRALALFEPSSGSAVTGPTS